VRWTIAYTPSVVCFTFLYDWRYTILSVHLVLVTSAASSGRLLFPAYVCNPATLTSSTDVFYCIFLFSGLFYEAVSDPIEHSSQFSGFLSAFIKLISVFPCSFPAFRLRCVYWFTLSYCARINNFAMCHRSLSGEEDKRNFASQRMYRMWLLYHVQQACNTISTLRGPESVGNAPGLEVVSLWKVKKRSQEKLQTRILFLLYVPRFG
jgi:hypothetical protein